MGGVVEVEMNAVALSSLLKRNRTFATWSAVTGILFFVAGLAFFSDNAGNFARWGSVGVGLALIWSFVWKNRISRMQDEYVFGLRGTNSELNMMMSGAAGAEARRLVNGLDQNLPKFYGVVLFVEIAMAIISTVNWGYGDIALCGLASWEVTSC